MWNHSKSVISGSSIQSLISGTSSSSSALSLPNNSSLTSTFANSRSLLPEGFSFPLAPPPVIVPFTPTWDIFQVNYQAVSPFRFHFIDFFLQETTARLLFMMVRWVKSLAPFQTLSRTDQVMSTKIKLSIKD